MLHTHQLDLLCNLTSTSSGAWRPSRTPSGTHEATNCIFLTQRKALSALFYIHELTDHCDWLVMPWLTGRKSVYRPHPHSKFCPPRNKWLGHHQDLKSRKSRFLNVRENAFLKMLFADVSYLSCFLIWIPPKTSHRVLKDFHVRQKSNWMFTWSNPWLDFICLHGRWQIHILWPARTNTTTWVMILKPILQ